MTLRDLVKRWSRCVDGRDRRPIRTAPRPSTTGSARTQNRCPLRTCRLRLFRQRIRPVLRLAERPCLRRSVVQASHGNFVSAHGPRKRARRRLEVRRRGGAAAADARAGAQADRERPWLDDRARRRLPFVVDGLSLRYPLALVDELFPAGPDGYDGTTRLLGRTVATFRLTRLVETPGGAAAPDVVVGAEAEPVRLEAEKSEEFLIAPRDGEAALALTLH
jgi:hypothetical protein